MATKSDILNYLTLTFPYFIYPCWYLNSLLGLSSSSKWVCLTITTYVWIPHLTLVYNKLRILNEQKMNGVDIYFLYFHHHTLLTMKKKFFSMSLTEDNTEIFKQSIFLISLSLLRGSFHILICFLFCLSPFSRSGSLLFGTYFSNTIYSHVNSLSSTSIGLLDSRSLTLL